MDRKNFSEGFFKSVESHKASETAHNGREGGVEENKVEGFEGRESAMIDVSPSRFEDASFVAKTEVKISADVKTDGEVREFMEIAENRGAEEAAIKARSARPNVIDEVHDALVERVKGIE